MKTNQPIGAMIAISVFAAAVIVLAFLMKCLLRLIRIAGDDPREQQWKELEEEVQEEVQEPRPRTPSRRYPESDWNTQ